MNIFVASLPFSIQESDLRASFEAFGTVDSVRIVTDKITGRSKGFGFVEMPNEEQATQAIAELNGATVQGRSIVVNPSVAKNS
ncbi:MAG: RNA-binding protein [Bacteroidetes bacterium]|nr:RNA-binding protein [Bacteroidota bacterium]